MFLKDRLFRNTLSLGTVFLFGLSLSAQQIPLSQRIAHTDPSQFQLHADVHQGAGPMSYMALFDQ